MVSVYIPYGIYQVAEENVRRSVASIQKIIQKEPGKKQMASSTYMWEGTSMDIATYGKVRVSTKGEQGKTGPYFNSC